MLRSVTGIVILTSLFFAFERTSDAAQTAVNIAASSGGFTLQVVGGNVWAWGNNGNGQLGDGTFISHAIPQQVPGLTSVVAVAAGGSHSLALKSDGTVWAWGANFNGQLGDGTFNFHATPNQVPGLTGINAIAAGQNHSLALKSDGTVWAWGVNAFGQLGDNTQVQKPSPVAVTTSGGLTGITAIAAGASHSLAIKTGGGVWAWGQNTNGQVGDGTSPNNKLVPTSISLATCAVGAATAIAGGTSHSLAVVGGTVCAWGLNGFGQLGDGTITQQNTPVATLTLTGITAVSAGSNHSLALKNDGTVWAWGNNNFGQLGDTTTTEQHSPVQSSGITNAVEIAAGNVYSVARLASPADSLLTWGAEGALGDGILSIRPVPLQIGGLSGVIQASAGNGYTLALLNSGMIVGLGNNGAGQLGDGTVLRHLTPVAVTGLTNITAISAGNGFSLARKNDGTVWAWGNNGNGQLGNGSADNNPHSLPAQVVGVGGSGLLANITGISASGTNNHSLAVSNTGVVYAWGLNNTGQLGVGDTNNRTAPAVVSGLSGIFTAVAAGNNHSLALRNDGTVWAWGNNSSGQLGAPIDFVAHSVPAQVSGLTGVVAIFAGNLSSFALKGDGSIWAWGGNNADPNFSPQPTPTENQDLPAILSLAAGNGYNLFLLQIGSIKWVGGWGNNSNGQLGNGTFNFSGSVPALGFGGRTPSSISANSHSLAVMTDGTVWGWGLDNNGQLGDSPAIFNATPTAPVARGVADLTVTKSHSSEPGAGSQYSYTITVTNVGQAATSGTITVTDTLPAGMSFASGVGTGWTCGAATGGASCTNPGPLAGGASSVITLTVNSTALMFPDQFNLVTVGNANEVHALNNTFGDEASVPTPTTVTLTPVPAPNPSLFGQSVSLTATVTPSAATGNVAFFDNAMGFLGTGVVSSGTAHLNTMMLPSGSQSLAAVFVPGSQTPYSYSISPLVTQTVNPVASASLTPLPTLILGGSKSGYLVAKGDFNGDGKMDIAAVDGGSHAVTIYLGNGSGGFTASAGGPFQTGNLPVALVASDLNGDGKADLAIANQGANTLTVLLGNGAGVFAPALGSPFAVGFTPTSLVLGDLNNDGTATVVIAGLSSTQLTVLNRDQFGNFFTGGIPLPSGSRSGIATADFNGDLNEDLAVSDLAGTVGILLNGNNGHNPLVSIPSAIHPQGIVAVDVNVDGKMDLVTWDATGVEVLLGNGSGGFAEAAGSPFVPGTGAITGISSVSVGDFNADGKPDLFVVRTPTATSKGEAVIMLGNGSGGFTQATGAGYASLSSNLAKAVVGEFNADGRTDVAVTDPGNDAVLVLRGVPTTGAQPISVGPSAGSAGRQVFNFVARDALGANSIQYTQFLISKAGLNALNACYISYDPVANVFYLLSDDLTQWYGLLGGSANTIGNAQCTIYGATSGSAKSGTDLTVHVDISFRSGFAGTKTLYQFSGDTLGAGSGWQAVGTWNDTGDPNAVELISLSPNSGTGLSQTFTAVIKDGSGATNIPFAQLVMNAGLNGINACFIHYDRASNVFFLLNDTGTATAPASPWSGLVAGSATSVSNSQCTLHGVGSGGTVSGSNLTVTYNLTFSAGFAGVKQIFMQAVDNTGVIEVWHQMATWNP